MQRHFIRTLLALSAAFGSLVPIDAFTQTVATEDLSLDESVVIAERREARLQDVPIAVSAVTAGQLESSGITSTDQLSGVVGDQRIAGVLFNCSRITSLVPVALQRASEKTTLPTIQRLYLCGYPGRPESPGPSSLGAVPSDSTAGDSLMKAYRIFSGRKQDALERIELARSGCACVRYPSTTAI